MRIFWALIGILVIATGVVVYSRGQNGSTPILDDEDDVVVAMTDATGGAFAADEADDEVLPATTEDAADGDDEALSGQPFDVNALADAYRLREGATVIPPAVETASDSDANTETVDDGDITEGDPASESGEDAAASGAVDPADLAVTIVERDDGSKLLDGDFIIRGAGTKDDPYEITWDLLLSAKEVYNPREGRNDLPERVTMLHDKYISVTGFVAFPLMTIESDEILVMLNQWDGCCVGTPPTPFDGIETTLATPMGADSGINVFHYGTIEGRLKVDPYVVNNWLVGLYVMEDAEVDLDI